MGSAHGAGNLGTFIGPAGLALIAGSSNFVSPEATANALIPAMNYFTGLYILALIAVLFRARLVARRVDLYLDTLYSAFEMIASGITTVQHLHGWVPGGLAAVEAGADEVIRAYEDIGMRVSYSFALRDQNRLVYQNDEEFTASVPAELRPALQRHFARFQVSLADYGALFERLHASITTRSGSRSSSLLPIFIGAPTRRSRCSPITRGDTTRRCTCTSSRLPIRKNMPAGGAAVLRSTISTASDFWGRD